MSQTPDLQTTQPETVSLGQLGGTEGRNPEPLHSSPRVFDRNLGPHKPHEGTTQDAFTTPASNSAARTTIRATPSTGTTPGKPNPGKRIHGLEGLHTYYHPGEFVSRNFESLAGIRAERKGQGEWSNETFQARLSFDSEPKHLLATPQRGHASRRTPAIPTGLGGRFDESAPKGMDNISFGESRTSGAPSQRP
ncbi:hypothetical protein CTI12_AA595620 [Artemisia annua]|uniref:Uncharacterized protein n=1 Tax=Artemisia annua TaxID=35608 RepID=A0A2U1KJI1_ARTAN|nr:hypothetical protein CTI12_AA595620 [Artemisia annua]